MKFYEYLTLQHIDISSLNLLLINLEFTLKAFVAHRVRRLRTPRKLIEEIDSQPESTPRCPSGRIKINVRLSNQARRSPTITQQQNPQTKLKAGVLPTPRVGTSPLIKSLNSSQSVPGQGKFRKMLFYLIFQTFGTLRNIKSGIRIGTGFFSYCYNFIVFLIQYFRYDHKKFVDKITAS